jgi:hypothetical protein
MVPGSEWFIVLRLSVNSANPPRLRCLTVILSMPGAQFFPSEMRARMGRGSLCKKIPLPRGALGASSI